MVKQSGKSRLWRNENPRFEYRIIKIQHLYKQQGGLKTFISSEFGFQTEQFLKFSTFVTMLCLLIY